MTSAQCTGIGVIIVEYELRPPPDDDVVATGQTNAKTRAQRLRPGIYRAERRLGPIYVRQRFARFSAARKQAVRVGCFWLIA